MRTYLTARELREITYLLQKHIKLPTNKRELMDMETVMIDHVQAQKEEDDLLINYVVASYDGSSEDILGRLLDGPHTEDFGFALAEAKKLKKSSTGQKNSDSGASSLGEEKPS